MGDQKLSFEHTAAEFEKIDRDIRDHELAQQKAEIQADALSVIQVCD
jgi:hypothetical protein